LQALPAVPFFLAEALRFLPVVCRSQTDRLPSISV
jgi:hypothetical protein